MLIRGNNPFDSTGHSHLYIVGTQLLTNKPPLVTSRNDKYSRRSYKTKPNFLADKIRKVRCGKNADKH